MGGPPVPTEGKAMSVPKTLVVHVKRAPCNVHIGWPSPFGNPFVIGRDGDRAAVIGRYRTWLLAQPALVERVRRELAGKVLGCWCAPLRPETTTRREHLHESRRDDRSGVP
jgi:hypothetical protein